MGAGGKVLDFVVWDVHNGSGADRHSDRHINGAAVRTHLPGDCRTAERVICEVEASVSPPPTIGATRNFFQPGSMVSKPPICACIHSATEPSA